MLFLQLPPVHSSSTARPPDPDIRSRSSRNLLNENPSIADAFGKNVREPILGGGLTVNPFPVSLRATAFDVYYGFTLAASSPCIPLLSQGVTAARSRVISRFRTYYISTSFLQVPGTQTTQMLVRHKTPLYRKQTARYLWWWEYAYS